MTAPAGRDFSALDQVESRIPRFDLDGSPINFREWVERSEDPDYYHQAEDYVRSDRGLVRVSTIWLGSDHRFYNPLDLPPIIFETMTFSDSPEYAHGQIRYCDLQSALAGHRMVADEMAQSWWLNLGGRG